MRYLYGFLGLTAVIAGFFLGFKFGLFLFPQDANKRGYQIASPLARNDNNESLRGAERRSNLEENFCIDDIKFSDENDKKFCFQKSKLTESRGVEIDLTNNKAAIYNEGKLIKALPLAYQSPEDKWFQAPTGYYRAGVKREKHLSSLFPVFMPYAIQYYEDFFIHGIPYHKNGENVSSEFTGGCLRFENEVAKEIYDFLKTGDQILVYKTFDDPKIKPEFHPPVDLKNFWIQKRFLSPYRQFRLFGGTDALKDDYYQHTGVDLRPTTNNLLPSVYAINDGRVSKIQINDGTDHGLGNTVILEHHPSADSEQVYSLYAHLSKINSLIKEGDIINKGEIIGEVGNSGFGCQNYWRIGPDGCDSQAPNDIHLHFEIKKAPVLENSKGGKACEDKINEPKRFCYGYTPDHPQKYGYLDPMEFLFDKRPEKSEFHPNVPN